jgi:putative ABC transport system permease protein
MIYYYAPDRLWRLSARVRPGDAAAALADAKRIWSGIFPETPFDYEFLQDRITAANADDARQSQLFAFFTGLAIIIACLGLSGLASFVAARRTREVAIRKVLGASTGRITRLLLWDFAKPVLLANLIAWPIAWILMRHWLDGFPYRIALSPAFFLGASALALAVALLTVFARTWRAARIRPATALKYE